MNEYILDLFCKNTWWKKTPKSLEAIVTSYSTFMSPASKYTDTEFSSWTARLKAYGCAEVLYFLKCV